MHFDFKNDVNELLKILKLALCHDMTPRGCGKKMRSYRKVVMYFSYKLECLIGSILVMKGKYRV